jgi:hypothetical protein
MAVSGMPRPVQSGALAAKRYLIIDRDTKYAEQFRRLVEEGGTEVIRLPPMSPNLNAYAERFVRSVKDECLKRMIFVGQASLRRAIGEYMAHYHEERNHQGLGNRLIRPKRSMQRTLHWFSAVHGSAACLTTTTAQRLEVLDRVSGHYGLTRARRRKCHCVCQPTAGQSRNVSEPFARCAATTAQVRH